MPISRKGCRVEGKFKVRIKRDARKALQSIPADIKAKIDAKIKRLGDNPWAESEGKLQGYDDRHKFRQGDWRVIYEIDDGEVTVEVVKIAHRREAYKG